MNAVFARLLHAVADRLHAQADAQAVAHGLEFTTLVDGTRVARHRDIGEIAAAHRARVIADPDVVDLMLIDPATRALAAREAAARRAKSSVVTR